MPDYSKNIIYLSEAQRQELFANDTITVDGVTVNYNENDIYVTPQAEPVTDVRVAGTSVAANGVANIPIASAQNVLGLSKVHIDYGLNVYPSGLLAIAGAGDNSIKEGTNNARPISCANQHKSIFYGLAKASGDTTQSQSSNTVGTYTPEAKGAIQSMLGVSDLIATAENNLVASKAYAIGDVFTANGKLYKATAVIAADGAIILQNEDEEINGHNAVECKIENTFIKKTDYATGSTPGIVRVGGASGIKMLSADWIVTDKATSTEIKAASSNYKPIVPTTQHEATFYGLAKAAGDTSQSVSSNAVGIYTDFAKASIKAMLGIQDGSTGTVDISGTTPTITAVENTRYVCGEVTSLDFTPPANGISIVRFTSGSTVTVLTIPSTVKFPEWFDSTSLETNTIYEICVTDGIYGAVMSWAL